MSRVLGPRQDEGVRLGRRIRGRRSECHTVGADLRKRGADIRDIQDVLRHADIGTTQIYTHIAREELRKKLPRRFVEYQKRKPV